MVEELSPISGRAGVGWAEAVVAAQQINNRVNSKARWLGNVLSLTIS
jgi:hypothetical protein